MLTFGIGSINNCKTVDIKWALKTKKIKFKLKVKKVKIDLGCKR